MLVHRCHRLVGGLFSLTANKDGNGHAGSSPMPATPRGLGFYTHPGRRVCDPHFPVESRSRPRPHSWHNLDLNQLGTGRSA